MAFARDESWQRSQLERVRISSTRNAGDLQVPGEIWLSAITESSSSLPQPDRLPRPFLVVAGELGDHHALVHVQVAEDLRRPARRPIDLQQSHAVRFAQAN